ncbi:MAG: hypothetical protein R3335_06975, partial [Anaerolineales bacterium]|nr:hypothetical protein [Anaerolineales bacterium]
MKFNRFFWAPILIGIVLVAAGAWLVFQKRGVPFVATREQWTIGIYRGDSPFTVSGSSTLWEPVLRAEDVTDISAKFVADPFLIQEAGRWYLFFEAYNNQTGQGDLAVATSENARSWNYDQVVLDEAFHLSYPYVFRWEGAYYMIPESYEANSVRLYRADLFPNRWTFVATLVEGDEFV